METMPAVRTAKEPFTLCAIICVIVSKKMWIYAALKVLCGYFFLTNSSYLNVLFNATYLNELCVKLGNMAKDMITITIFFIKKKNINIYIYDNIDMMLLALRVSKQ